MRGALKDLALEIWGFLVNELGKLCRFVTQCIGERQLELLLRRELPLLRLGRSQLILHWRLHLLLLMASHTSQAPEQRHVRPTN